MMVFMLAAGVFLLLSLSPYHHWDEYYYLFSVLHHAPSALLELEPALSEGIFPNGFFSAKFGFVIFLHFLVQAFGDGLWALLIIQFIFAVLVVGFVAASYGLLREILTEREALHTAVVLMFLPVSVYFGYKVLSEVPSLLLTTLGCWAFVRSFRARHTSQLCLYLCLSIAGLFMGIQCRASSALMFAGLALGLLVLHEKRYPWTKVLMRTSVVSACLIGLAIAYVALLGLNADRYMGLITSVTKRSPGLIIQLYALGMSIQFLVPAFFLAAMPPYDRKIRFAWVWVGVCTLPFLLGAQYAEPRYFYMALVPLAMLIYTGLHRLAGMLYLARYQTGWVLLLAVLVLGNRWLLAPLMIYEIDQYHYTKAMAELTHQYQGATFLVPWISDYGFLRFAFPEQQVKLSWSKANSDNISLPRAIRHWVGADSYVGSFARLSPLPQPWIYMGWTYNPTLVQLQKRLEGLGMESLRHLVQYEGLKNHLTLSWIWSHPALVRRQVLRSGPYHGFELRWHDSALSLQPSNSRLLP